MTTTPTRPTFIQAPNGLACPAPGCNKTYIYKAAADKHWDKVHDAPEPRFDPPADEDLPWPDDDQADDPVDELHRRMFPEAYDEDGNPLPDDDETPPAEATTPQGTPSLGADDAGVEGPGEAVETHPLASPARPGSAVDILTRTHGTPTNAITHAVPILVDALIRLRAAGYPSGEARRLVFDLIDRLTEPHTAA